MSESSYIRTAFTPWLTTACDVLAAIPVTNSQGNLPPRGGSNESRVFFQVSSPGNLTPGGSRHRGFFSDAATPAVRGPARDNRRVTIPSSARNLPADSATPADPADPAVAPPRPSSLADLFLSFTWLALQGFGGVLAVVQRELVERKRWLTREEFVEDWAVAQIMPGPNVVNLSLMLGHRYFGLQGALVALAGMLAAPLLVVLALALAYAQFAGHPQVMGALRGMGAVAAGLIAATGLKLLGTLSRNPMGRVVCVVLAAATFIAIALLRLPLALVLLVLGSLGFWLTWRRIS